MLGRTSRTLEDNIKMYLDKRKCKIVNYILKVRDSVHIYEPSGSIKAGHFLVSWVIMNCFSKKILHKDSLNCWGIFWDNISALTWKNFETPNIVLHTLFPFNCCFSLSELTDLVSLHFNCGLFLWLQFLHLTFYLLVRPVAQSPKLGCCFSTHPAALNWHEG
jgi:hypothetical protein